MSVAAVKWVLEAAPEHSAIARAVALVLAWHHTDDGAFPERATLASATRLSDGSVGKALRELVAEGTIYKAGARRGGGTIVWRFPAIDGPAPDAGPDVEPEPQPVQRDTLDREPVQRHALVQREALVQRHTLAGPAPRADDRSLKDNNGQGSGGATGLPLGSRCRTDVAGETGEETLF